MHIRKLLQFSYFTEADSQGCYCWPQADSRCRYGYDHGHRNPSHVGAQEECRWAIPFVRWLRAKSSASVVSVNMAVAASNPGIIAIDLIRRLKELGVAELSHRDLILLDYSLNEVEIYSSKSTGWFDLSSGMERLIRNLFSLAVSNASYPAVVLLETYPHGPSSTGKIDYPKSYSRLARHYSLPIWSFRDIYWSPFALLHADQSRFIAELRPPDHPVCPPRRALLVVMRPLHSFYCSITRSGTYTCSSRT